LFKDTRLSEEVRADWIKRNLNLLVLKEDMSAYQNYLNMVSKTAKNTQAKCAIIRESSKLIIQNLAENPRSEKLIGQTMETVKDLIHVVMENPGAFYAIMKLNSYDYYTFTHSVNVATLSIALGVAAGVSKVNDLTDLALGAILHDIGKSQIDQALINKPGTLTENEYRSVTSHVIKGYEMLRWNSSITAQALIPLMQHHEKLNGSGYPNNLQGSQIHIFGRIVAIIDVYDALTTERVYRKELKPFDALSIISKAFNDYDRDLFARLVNLIRAQKAQEE
jgi:putative nucleotidyltransferase with HDIG domain